MTLSKQNISVRLAKILNKEASEEEIAEFYEYLKVNPEEQYFFDIIERYWQTNDSINLSAINPIALEENFDNILLLAENQEFEQQERILNSNITTKSPVKQKSYRIFKTISVAASLIFVLGIFFLFRHKQKLPILNNQVASTQNAKSKIILPDGSTVVLNKGSKITFNNNFQNTNREVYLEGEGFFNVVKNAKKPFIVHTSSIGIKVLGTIFNVRNYTTDGNIEATLLKGSIEVSNENDPKAPKIILKPHEKLIFNKHQVNNDLQKDFFQKDGNYIDRVLVNTLPDKPDTTLPETDWLYDKMIFDGEPFIDVSKKIERQYNVVITFNNTNLENYKLHGEFKNETIEEVLNTLQLTFSFKYTKHGKNIEIF